MCLEHGVAQPTVLSARVYNHKWKSQYFTLKARPAQYINYTGSRGYFVGDLSNGMYFVRPITAEVHKMIWTASKAPARQAPIHGSRALGHLSRSPFGHGYDKEVGKRCVQIRADVIDNLLPNHVSIPSHLRLQQERLNSSIEQASQRQKSGRCSHHLSSKEEFGYRY